MFKVYFGDNDKGGHNRTLPVLYASFDAIGDTLYGITPKGENNPIAWYNGGKWWALDEDGEASRKDAFDGWVAIPVDMYDEMVEDNFFVS